MNTSVNTSTLLADELGQLSVQIEQTRQKQESLESELRAVDAELETFSADRQRFDLLRNACTALDKLVELKAGDLFWEGVCEPQNIAGHLERAKSRVARFEGEISGILKKQADLQGQINGCLDDLDVLNEEVRAAYARDERRLEEYLVERDITPVPNRLTLREESEERFRRALIYAFLFFFCFGTVMRIWKLPPPPRPVVAVVPQRLVSMLKKERPKPEPPKPKEEKKPEKEQEKKTEKQQEQKPANVEKEVAREKAESSGVLAFKNTFKDLMEETPSAHLGAEARLSNQPSAAAGQARASRSIIAMEGGSGGSGGISNSGVSRNIGHGNGSGIGGVGFTRVQSSIAGLKGESKPLSAGIGPARTDEEIQIVFDKYKASLYRMYNMELRKNPTLRGKVLLRITIEPGGEVSACSVQSSDLASPELVAQVVERVKKFNFGPKEKVPKTTILYPIDFLPGG
ncbi:MAG TPA: AgmX/PglI C-terminal domain-containing protein [Nitrospirota bacterium]